MALVGHRIRAELDRATALTDRDLYVAGLLPDLLDFCEHQPAEVEANEVAVCDLCANKLVILVDRYDEPEDILH